MGLMTGWYPSPPAGGGRGGVLGWSNDPAPSAATRHRIPGESPAVADLQLSPLMSTALFRPSGTFIIRHSLLAHSHQARPSGMACCRTPASIEGCDRVRADLMERQFVPDPGNGGFSGQRSQAAAPLHTSHNLCWFLASYRTGGHFAHLLQPVGQRTPGLPCSGIGALPRLCFKFVSQPLLTCRLS